MRIALNLLITLARIKAKYSKEKKQREEVHFRVDSLVPFLYKDEVSKVMDYRVGQVTDFHFLYDK